MSGRLFYADYAAIPGRRVPPCPLSMLLPPRVILCVRLMQDLCQVSVLIIHRLVLRDRWPRVGPYYLKKDRNSSLGNS